MNEHERWQAQIGLEDAHRTEVYYTRIAERSRRWRITTSMVSTLGAVVTGTLAGASFMLGGRDALALVGLGFGLLASAAGIVALVFDYAGRSIKAAQLAKDVSLTLPAWRSLLLTANGDGSSRLEELSRRQKEIEAPVSGELPFNDKINRQAAKVARAAVMLEIHQEAEEEESVRLRISGKGYEEQRKSD